MSRKGKKRPDLEAELVVLDVDSEAAGPDAEQVSPESGEQSGDTQGLSTISEAADESVAELAKEGQAFEAEIVEGVEDAEKHAERPVHIHEEQRPSHESELPPDFDCE